MKELLLILRFLPEIRAVLVAIGDLLSAGKNEEAAAIVRDFKLQTAAGKAAWWASRNAGPKR